MPQLSESQLEFVTFIHQHHGLTGELLTEQKAKDEYGFTLKFFRECMADSLVRDALDERGISLRDFHTDAKSWRSQALTSTQLLVANSLLDLTDTRSDKRKLQDYNVSPAKYQQWLRDPVFQHYIRNRAEALLGDSQHIAHLALIDKVNQGDIKAIQYLNELTGRFTPKSAGADQSNVVVNLQQIIVRIVEIVTDEVDDPQVASRIADRMDTLMTGHMLATSAEQPEVIKPEIKQAREYTPHMLELLESGEGVNS